MNGQVPRDVIEYQLIADEADRRPRGRRGVASSSSVSVDKHAGEPLGLEIASAAVRPRPHLRQPLRVLLHLPAAKGHAAEPLPEGRRLPPLVPLRELHDAHPLHRGRPRAGRRPAPVAAVRLDPRHRSRGPRHACCATAAAPSACAGCAACSTTGSRCTARSSSARALNDGAVLRRHPRRHARPLPRARHRRRRAARGEPLLERGGHAPAHHRRGAKRPSRRWRSGRSASAAPWTAPRVCL